MNFTHKRQGVDQIATLAGINTSNKKDIIFQQFKTFL